jgi:DNA-binding NarL/FixJ family response regulator
MHKPIVFLSVCINMINVLVIEDHGIVRAGIGHLVEAEQDLDIVAMAADGDEAMRLMENGIKPEVVLTDLHLGDACGITLAQTLLKRYPELKIMILTMEADDRYLSQAFQAGVKGYLLKETDYDELVYGIRKVSQGKDFICTGMTARLRQRMAKSAAHSLRNNVPVDISRREAEILNLLADGFTNMEIADKLFTSKRTVEGHRQSLINKTGVKNTPELVKYAMLNGLLQMAS